jgi:hypothetical protein
LIRRGIISKREIAVVISSHLEWQHPIRLLHDPSNNQMAKFADLYRNLAAAADDV